MSILTEGLTIINSFWKVDLGKPQFQLFDTSFTSAFTHITLYFNNVGSNLMQRPRLDIKFEINVFYSFGDLVALFDRELGDILFNQLVPSKTLKSKDY